jgi:hypothetical protein
VSRLFRLATVPAKLKKWLLGTKLVIAKITQLESVSRAVILRSIKGTLLEKPLNFGTLINFGVVPQEADIEKHRVVFSRLLEFISRRGCDVLFERLGPKHRVVRVPAHGLNENSFYRALRQLGDEFDVLVFSSDPSWATIVSAGDRIVVFGAKEAILNEVLQSCGGINQIWDAVKESLKGPAFSESFWRRQTSAILSYDKGAD